MADVHYRSFDYSVKSMLPQWARELRTPENRALQWKGVFEGLSKSDPQPGVAIQDGKVVGVVWPGLDEQDRSTGFNHFVYVDPDHLHKGIGRKLQEFADEQFRKAGCKREILLVFEENTEARNFYEHLGWTYTGETKQEPIDQTDLFVTAMVMERIL